MTLLLKRRSPVSCGAEEKCALRRGNDRMRRAQVPDAAEPAFVLSFFFFFD